MAKQIHNPVEVVLHFNDDGTWTVSGWTKYHLTCSEYPGLISKDIMLDLEFTQPQKDAIVQFASTVIYPQIATKENM